MKHLLLTTIAAVVLVGCGESAKDIPFWKAAGDGNIEAVKQQFAAGADVDAKGGMLAGTPLHYAAIKGHKEVVELLIAAGADVNAKDVNGKTPLDLANLEEHTETADLLRKHGGKTSEELK